MSKLQEISSAPDYDAAASSFSKLIMLVFFVSYVYMVITSSGDPGGWVGPTLFLLVGLFVSSIFISMPFFILKRLFPRASILVTLASIGITYFLTKVFFLWLLV